ncbi:MAG: hypothetical protein ABR927_12615 [Bacteroidales bacterium]|jgi:hypothetical protein
MKKFYLTTSIAVFLLLCTNGIQAQTTQTKLNQVELMKQFIALWKCDVAKDTTLFAEDKSYGTGQDCYFKFVTKGKIVMEERQLRGYDKKLDKYIVAAISKGNDIELYAVWFVSKNKYEWIPLSDISNPEGASFKYEGEFKSPDTLIETTIENNKPVKIDNWTRVK